MTRKVGLGIISLLILQGLLFAQKPWSLQACIDTAFKKNISLNQGQLTSQIDKINLVQAKAALAPNLNLSDAHNVYSGFNLNPYTYQYSNQSFYSNSPSLNSTMTLYNGFLLLNTIRQTRYLYDASKLDVETTKNTIILNILAGYMQVLMDYDAIDVAQSQVTADSALVVETRKFVDFGKVAELSLLQVQSQLSNDNLTKITAETQLQLDKVTLLQLMDTPIRDDFDIIRQELKDLLPEVPVSTEKIDSISESFLPQIKSFALKTKAAQCSLKMAVSGWIPKLVLSETVRTGYYSTKENITEQELEQSETIGYLNGNPFDPVIGMVPYTSVNMQNETLGEQLHGNLGQILNLTLSVPIFNNLLVKSAVDIAKINVTNARLNEQQTKNDLRKSIETAYTNQVSAGKKLVATEEQMRLEKRTYQDMGKKYEYGAVDATDFLIETNNFNKVSMTLVQAKYNYVMTTKIVDFYLGKPLTF